MQLPVVAVPGLSTGSKKAWGCSCQWSLYLVYQQVAKRLGLAWKRVGVQPVSVMEYVAEIQFYVKSLVDSLP